MGDSIIRLNADDFDELMPLLSRAFGKPAPDWFAVNYSSVFYPANETMRNVFALRRGKRLAAAVGAFPMMWHFGGAKLRLIGIGGVCCDPDFRKQGLMRRLMDHVVTAIRREGCQISWLIGQRQRYGYWGWEKAGVALRVQVTQSNLRHCFASPVKMELEEIGDDETLMPQLKAMHDRQDSWLERPADRFTHFVHHHQARVFIARGRDKKLLGYVAVRDNTAPELVAVDVKTAVQIVRAAVEQIGSLNFILNPGELSRAVGRFAEQVDPLTSGNWRVFDWPAVVDATLRARQAIAPMMEGSVVIGIEGQSTNLLMETGGKAAQCRPTQRKADVRCDVPTLTRLLFGPAKPSMIAALPARAAILEAWCPLPLSISPSDHV